MYCLLGFLFILGNFKIHILKQQKDPIGPFICMHFLFLNAH